MTAEAPSSPADAREHRTRVCVGIPAGSFGPGKPLDGRGTLQDDPYGPSLSRPDAITRVTPDLPVREHRGSGDGRLTCRTIPTHLPSRDQPPSRA